MWRSERMTRESFHVPICGFLCFCSFTAHSVYGIRDVESFDLEPTGLFDHLERKRALPLCQREWFSGGLGCAQKKCKCSFYELCSRNECRLNWKFTFAGGLALVGTLSAISLVQSVQEDEYENGFYEAALSIRNAMDGIQRPPPRDTWWSYRCYNFHLMHLPMLHVYSVLLLILTIWEQPPWCHQDRWNGEELCENDFYPSFRLPLLVFRKSLAMECIFLAPFIMDTCVSWFAQGRNFWHSQRKILLTVALSLNCIDILYALTRPTSGIRLSHYLRAFFLLDQSHEIRACFRLVLHILPHIRTIILLVFCYISVFTLAGCILFPIGTPEGDKYFRGFAEGMWSLMVLITTANFPDVMMPAYHEGRSAFLFFLLYIIFGIYFLVNLTTASVCAAYNEEICHNELLRADIEAACMAQAHEALSIGAPVTKKKLLRFFDHISPVCPKIKYLSKNRARDIIASINKDESDCISADEFKCLIPALKQRTKKVYPPPMMETCFPSVVKNSYWIAAKTFVASNTLDWIINVIVMIGLVLMIWDHYEALFGLPEQEDWLHRGIIVFLEYFFTVLYSLEISFKVFVLGFGRFWHELRNKFDLVCTIASLILLVANYLKDSRETTQLISLIRVPRVLSILANFQTFREVTQTFAEVSAKVSSVVGFYLVTMYLFSVLGLHLFGGVITLDERSDNYNKIKESKFGKSDYWENNFNDIPSGMVTLFELTVINNWHVIASGFSAVCGKRARIFFIAFYMIGVLITFNIVLAIVLDTFSNSYVKEVHQEINDAPALSTEERLRLLEDTLRKHGLDPLKIEKAAVAAPRQTDEDEDFNTNISSNSRL